MKVKAQEFLEEFGDDEDTDGEFVDGQSEKKVPSKDAVLEWFKENPNPSDKEVHAWAEENDFDTHKLESVIYSLVTEYIKVLEGEDGEDELEDVDITDEFYKM